MPVPLAWQPVDPHTASNEGPAPFITLILSVPPNTQCLLTAPVHWVKLHGHRDQPWKTPQTGGSANCSVVLSVCARPQRAGSPGISQHTAEQLFMYADTHMHAQITSHIVYPHTQCTPTSTPGWGYRALLMLGRQELMEERGWEGN